jgi:hypothetical protein
MITEISPHNTSKQTYAQIEKLGPKGHQTGMTDGSKAADQKRSSEDW